MNYLKRGKVDEGNYHIQVNQKYGMPILKKTVRNANVIRRKGRVLDRHKMLYLSLNLFLNLSLSLCLNLNQLRCLQVKLMVVKLLLFIDKLQLFLFLHLLSLQFNKQA